MNIAINTSIFVLHYQSCVDSSVISCFICWYGSLNIHSIHSIVKVGTFNVRTLRTDFRAFELRKLAADLKILVINKINKSPRNTRTQKVQVRCRFPAQSSKRMEDSPWSSLRSRCWWYRFSSVVVVSTPSRA